MLDDARVAELARALAHPARVHIIRRLAEQSECSGAEIFSELPLAQSTISEHLRVLKDTGLVRGRPVGTATVYCIDSDRLRELALVIGTIANSTPSCSPAENSGVC